MDNWNLPPRLVEDAFVSLDTVQSLPWHITQYGVDSNVWPVADGTGIKWGIVDTGVSKYHAEQGGLAGAVLAAQDFSGSRFGWEDHNGHGTHVAGILGGRAFGVAPKCQLIIGKALGEGGAGSDRAVAAALDYCAKNGANGINLSLGSPTDSPYILGMIKELAEDGIIIPAAAGNDGGAPNSPGRDEHTICAAAIDQNGLVAPFSCHGPEVDCCAPGVQILSLGIGQQLVFMSGTSMATPWVSGILADYQSWLLKRGMSLLKSVGEALTWITAAADDLGATGTDEFYGIGLPSTTKMFNISPAVPVKVSKPAMIKLTMTDGSTYEFLPAK